jgi:hypothetical protein
LRDRAESAGGVEQAISEKLAELPRRKAGILDNAAHRERVYGVMPWDGHDPPAVGHDDVLALPRDLKANLLKRPNSPKVGDPSIFGTRYAGISTSLRFCRPANSLATSRYSRMAS